MGITQMGYWGTGMVVTSVVATLTTLFPLAMSATDGAILWGFLHIYNVGITVAIVSQRTYSAVAVRIVEVWFNCSEHRLLHLNMAL